VGRRYLHIDLMTSRAEVLVARLFAKALACVRAAGSGEADAPARLRDLRRALDILAELRSALDLAAGGEIAHNLDRLYEFASERLMRAAVGFANGPIDDALRVLEPLAEAWHELAVRPPAHGDVSAA
jgi:flagellar protein FliS